MEQDAHPESPDYVSPEEDRDDRMEEECAEVSESRESNEEDQDEVLPASPIAEPPKEEPVPDVPPVSVEKVDDKVTYHPVPLEQKEVAIQRLVLILTIEEQEVKKPVSDAQGGDNIVQSLSFCGILGKVQPLQSIKKTFLQLFKRTSLQSIKKTSLQSLKKAFL